MQYWDSVTYNKYVDDSNLSTGITSGNELFWVNSFSTSLGTFDAEAATNSQIEEKFIISLTISLPDSLNEANSIEYPFIVWIKHPCADNELSIEATDQLGDLLYLIDLGDGSGPGNSPQ